MACGSTPLGPRASFTSAGQHRERLTGLIAVSLRGVDKPQSTGHAGASIAFADSFNDLIKNQRR